MFISCHVTCLAPPCHVRYMSSPMTDTELTGTKALGQAVMGLVERAEQTHAKVRWPTVVTPWLT
jgi:hypothetical protein